MREFRDNISIMNFLFKKIIMNYKFILIMFLLFISVTVMQIIVVLATSNNIKYKSSISELSQYVVSIIYFKTIVSNILFTILSFVFTYYFIKKHQDQGILSLEIKAGVKLKYGILYRLIIIFTYCISTLLICLFCEYICTLFIKESFKHISSLTLNKYSFYLLNIIITVSFTFLLFNFIKDYVVYILFGSSLLILPLVSYLMPVLLKSNQTYFNTIKNSAEINTKSIIFDDLYKLSNSILEDNLLKSSLNLKFDIGSTKDKTVSQGNFLNDNYLNRIKKENQEFFDFISYIHDRYKTIYPNSSISDYPQLNNFYYNKVITIETFDPYYFFNILKDFNNHDNNLLYKDFFKNLEIFSKKFIFNNTFNDNLYIDDNSAKIDINLWEYKDLNKYTSFQEISMYWLISTLYQSLDNFSIEREKGVDSIEILIDNKNSKIINSIKTLLYLNPIELFNQIRLGSYYNKGLYYQNIGNYFDDNNFTLGREYWSLKEKTIPIINTDYKILNYEGKKRVIFNYEGFYFFLLILSFFIIWLNYYKLKLTIIS
ncbi:hypothetical protein [Spiroplasma apis]|uniref:Uncharacterized protein n=1 Tax=Spiroplasma apis B31 TaxID=1276258 RepID=V5RJE4_SPIAP|nr:hypothetical protein [Spiroplasma apis]AHB36231.1 hypothetical protein SAPIS_v1c03850 [Spiroplasma apis B31]